MTYIQVTCTLVCFWSVFSRITVGISAPEMQTFGFDQCSRQKLNKLPLRLAVAFHNVDSVTYVTIDNIMLPFYILYSRIAVAF